MTDSEIITQLKRLAEACPEDRCDIWVSVVPGGKLQYTCYIGSRDKLPSASTGGASPQACVDEILPQVVGKRGNLQNIVHKQNAIAKLKAEVAKLESEIDPLLGAIAEVKGKEQAP